MSEFISIEHKNDYAIVTLCKGRVNSITFDFVKEIDRTFQSLQQDDKVRGVMLAGQPGFFSVGMDMPEIVTYTPEDLQDFGVATSEMFMTLSTFSKPLVVAVTGHAPAYGTLLMSAGDYRIMADKPKYILGFNELNSNMPLPYDIIQGLLFHMGTGVAYPYLMEGKLMNPQSALETGLVNEICPDDEVLDRAEKQLQVYIKTAPVAFAKIKLLLRREWIAVLEERLPMARETWGPIWQTPEIKASLDAFAKRV